MKYITKLFIFSTLAFFLVEEMAAQSPTLSERIPGSKVSFQLTLVPGGIFTMGNENGPANEQPPRQVQLDSFWMGTTEVGYDEFIIFYQKQYDSDSTAHPAQAYKADAISRPTPQYIDYTYGMGKSGFPAVSMTQQAALRYCQWLYEKTGNFYRLPTEAEWEYACRYKVGSSAVGSWQLGAELSDYAWYYNNSFEKYHVLAQKKPNALGLYDMLGNVAEWTLDFYDDDYLQNLPADPAKNPWIEPTKRHSRTVKGGSYDSNSSECTCSARKKSESRWQARDPQIPKSRWWNPDSPFVGFRVVRPVKPMTKTEVDAFFEKAIKD
ncbi:MAG: formylglycine-generating enzyme family protein [Saprospiraceae bacterium]|nr:formylglycine-generating enzyme family protein [Saprospiraceae bacterium]MCF8251463.1 formylglycine-generating enzyme family protein [Saprospiraceae bacterium]MCF8282227.1 formylglycine-generating enzyme family protein [Bacteroidales bacterium]MCF8313057.1 formylglycine-generating enzyme family protein [Saprospiraceae bacterium]MCF8441505.1 formylglycine-generating enzyme family protein [Saprospiraceae bacterium]